MGGEQQPRVKLSGTHKDVIDIDWQQLQEALTSSRRDRVARVIIGCPSVRTVRKAARREIVQHTLRHNPTQRSATWNARQERI